MQKWTAERGRCETVRGQLKGRSRVSKAAKVMAGKSPGFCEKTTLREI